MKLKPRPGLDRNSHVLPGKHLLDYHALPIDQRAQEHGAGRGIVAKLTRAIVVGPIARLELLPLDASAGNGEIIEAQIPAQEYHALGLQTDETLLLTPRKARVFVA